MASAKRQAAQPPVGERVASLEATVPNLAAVMEKGFKDLGDQLKTLNGQVLIIANAEAARGGAESERKKHEKKTLAWVAGLSTIVGGVVDAAINFFHHN